MGHVVLLGDSIFDNEAYVDPPAGIPVIGWLRQELPHGWQATLLARDGSTTEDVPRQLGKLSADATHLVVSAGGNDALLHAGFLEEGARSAAEVVWRLAEIREEFRQDYTRMVEVVRQRDKPVTLCTIYDPCYPEPRRQRLAVTALSAFNDVILRLAIQHGLPVVDLRLTCREEADYDNPIEPSSQGGARIAAAIVRLLARHDFDAGVTSIYY